MSLTLGLDLGTNSIGWAIINAITKEIIGMGVRIFPEGVINLGQGDGREMSKSASRTDARGTRRQYYRRKMRKERLLKILQSAGMCPMNTDINSAEMTAWFRLPPNQLRYEALQRKLTLEEIGRIFYHIAQRRGFQSNSRSAMTNEDSKIFENDPKKGLTGINTTRALIQNGETGTLGGALYKDIIQPYQPGEVVARRRRTERRMYVEEFEKIWDAQATFHKLLTPELKAKIGGRKRDGYTMDGVLFFQRPLKSQKHRVGKCSFEPTKTKIPMSHPLFEKSRAWQFINTIECDGLPLEQDEKEKVFKKFQEKERLSFGDIRGVLNKKDDNFKFNYPDKDTRPGCPTIYKLSHKKCFGAAWFDFTEKEQEDIWHVFYSFDDREKLEKYAQEKWGFDEEKAKYAASGKMSLKEGYGSLSRKAILNILPFLEQGKSYDKAVVLGGVKNAFGDLWEQLSTEDLEDIDTNIEKITSQRFDGGFIGAVKEFLKLRFNFSEHQFKKLYHHSAAIHSTNVVKRLPTGADADREISKLRNPIVSQALFELRKLVNQLLDDYGKFDSIKVELARDLKINKEERKKIRDRNNARETYHLKIKKELVRLGQPINHENILKYKLWEECEKICPYTGAKIGCQQLFDGTFEIEHIFPFSKSADDSYLNKTLCEASFNADKGAKTPFEYFSIIGGFEKFKNRVQKIFVYSHQFPNRYKKFKRLVSEKMDINFVSRQLNDTRYISKEAKNYLQKICANVQVAPGQMTSKLRYHWGVNNIINHDNESKNRKDHRHHAIDALVMACTTAGHLEEISKWNRYKRSYDLKDFPNPMPNFRQQAIEATKRILVSHKKSNRVMTTRQYTVKKKGKTYTNSGTAARGQLHKETVYGQRQSPQQSAPSFHVRKPLDTFKKWKQLENIVDDNIRKIIEKHLTTGGYIKPNGDIIPGAFTFKNEETNRLETKVFLPNKNGNPIPIYKVRIRTQHSNAQRLKAEVNQWVNPRNNHHVLIYRNEEDKLKEHIVTFWEAVNRRRNKEKVFALPVDGVEIETTLEINDLFLLNLSAAEIDTNNLDYRILSQHLYRVQKVSASDYNFIHHLASTSEFKDDLVRVKSFKKWQEINPLKVKVLPHGKLQFV